MDYDAFLATKLSYAASAGLPVRTLPERLFPFQQQVTRWAIERGIRLWTNPGDVVLDPFAGIGSTGYSAVQMGRKFIGIELKESYYRQAESNLLEASQGQSLFAWAQEQEEDTP